MNTTERVQYGYRITDPEGLRVVVWPNELVDNWLPEHEDPYVPRINFAGRDPVQEIESTLAKAGVQGQVVERYLSIAWADSKEFLRATANLLRDAPKPLVIGD